MSVQQGHAHVYPIHMLTYIQDTDVRGKSVFFYSASVLKLQAQILLCLLSTLSKNHICLHELGGFRCTVIQQGLNSCSSCSSWVFKCAYLR